MNPVAQITPAELSAQRAGITVLDVREPAQVATGWIAGSVHLPLPALLERVFALSPGLPVITVSQRGHRGQRAAIALAAAGFSVCNLAGGMNRWVAEGRPVAGLARHRCDQPTPEPPSADTADRISWEVCPICGQTAAVGWATVHRDGAPVEELVDFECTTGCRLRPQEVSRTFR